MRLLLKLANKLLDGLLWLVSKFPVPPTCIHGRVASRCVECIKDWHASGGW